jgi:hypothetical protein
MPELLMGMHIYILTYNRYNRTENVEGQVRQYGDRNCW